jgi:hypothetical protein
MHINKMVATRNSYLASRLVAAIGDGQLKFYMKIYHKRANKLCMKEENRMWGRGLGSCFLGQGPAAGSCEHSNEC